MDSLHYCKNFENDKSSIIKKYNELGYRDAKISFDTILINNDNTISINVKVDEGEKYFFGDVFWIGNKIYSNDELSKRLSIKFGDIYNQTFLEEKLFGNANGDDISSLYLDDGYLFFNASPSEIVKENNSKINLLNEDLESIVTKSLEKKVNSITMEEVEKKISEDEERNKINRDHTTPREIINDVGLIKDAIKNRIFVNHEVTFVEKQKDKYLIKLSNNIKIKSKGSGLFMIGGGVPKNFIQDTVICAELLGKDVEMHKYAVQITVADSRDGACSSSTLKEASSWGKVDVTKEQMVFAEATSVLPLIASDAYHKGEWKNRDRRNFTKIFG